MTALSPSSDPARTAPTPAATRTRAPWMTVFLCIALVAVYVWQGVRLGDSGHFSGAELVGLGGNAPPLTLGPQPWRLLTSLFLHASVAHLLANLIAMLAIVAPLETMVPRWKWGLFFLGGGVFAGYASACAHYGHDDVVVLGRHMHRLFVSVGISGAIMSATGALIALVLCRRMVKASTGSGKWLRIALIFSVLNLLYGFLRPGVDNTAHAYGLAFGLVGGFSLLLPCGLHSRTVRGLVRALWIVIGAAILATLAGSLWSGLPSAQERANHAADMRDSVAAAQAEQKAARASERERNQHLSYVDASEAVGRRIAIPNVSAIARLSDEGTLLVAANGDASRIIEYDLRQDHQVRVVAQADYPDGTAWGCPAPECSGVGVATLTVDPENDRVYAGALYRGAVSAIDLKSGHIVYTVPTGSYPSRLLLHENRLYAYDILDGTVTILDAARGKRVDQIKIPVADGTPDPRWARDTDSPLVIDDQAMYMLTRDGHAARMDFATHTVTVLETPHVQSIGQDGTGAPWMLTPKGIYTLGVQPEQRDTFHLPEALRQPAILSGPLMDVDGEHPMVLVALSEMVLGVSPVSNTVRRRWPLALDEDTWITKALDSRHFYLPGPNDVQLFDMARSHAPGEMAVNYNTLLRMDAQKLY